LRPLHNLLNMETCRPIMRKETERREKKARFLKISQKV